VRAKKPTNMADSSSSSCPPPTTSEMPSQATQKMSTNSEVIPRDGPPRAVTKIPDHPTQATMYQLLGARLKCTLTDGRIATGTFICLDRLYVSICKTLYDNWKIYGMIVWVVPQCNACGICVSRFFLMPWLLPKNVSLSPHLSINLSFAEKTWF